jgi:hypothetical protein
VLAAGRERLDHFSWAGTARVIQDALEQAVS